MIRKTLPLFAIAVAMLFTTIASAQSEWLVANIPFDFHVGDTSLARGVYRVQLVNGCVLKVIAADSHGAAVGMSMPTTNDKRGEKNLLVFSQYGNQYFLSKVLWAGHDNGRMLLPAKVEQELARQTRTLRAVEAADNKR